MNEFDREIYLVQNPAIGAVILWRFAYGYYTAGNDFKQVPFPLMFIILPIIFREDLRNVISSTNKSSGLQKISEKLFKNKNSDLFFSIQDASIGYRSLTLSAISLAMSKKLITLSYKTALITPNQIITNKIHKSSEDLWISAEKLGIWCSSLSLQEIGALLKVRF